MRHIRFALLPAVTLLALLAGCGDKSALSPDRSELELNRQKWLAHRPSPYAFTVQRACFCLATGPVRVYVQADTVYAAIVLKDGTDAHFGQTIEDLFQFIDNAIVSHAAVIRATYDPDLGFPTSIEYDGSASAADDEVDYTLSDVKPAYFAPNAARDVAQGMAPAAPARRGSAPAVTRP